MNGATVDGGTGQFSLHRTICTSVCVVSLLQPPACGGIDAAKSSRVVVSVCCKTINYRAFQLHRGLKVSSEHLTLSCNLAFLALFFLLHKLVLRGI